MNRYAIENLALWLIPVCIICARAYYVIFKWDNYKKDRWCGNEKRVDFVSHLS